MNAKEFLEAKGWSKDSPTVGGAFWMGMVEILEEYYQHKSKAENLPISGVRLSLPDYNDAEKFIQEEKDIWSHPYITNRVNEGFDLVDILVEFVRYWNAKGN